jgi:8-oxo-dGTP diphosphatase
LWQFPAGKIEPDETAEAAAVRETYEEVGLVVDPIAKIGERIHPATGRVIVYVACSVVRGEAHPAAADEIAEVAWCTRAEITDYIPEPFSKPVQEYLAERLK